MISVRKTINQRSDFNQELLEKATTACLDYISGDSKYPKEYRALVRHIEASLPSATYRQISYSDLDLYIEAAIINALVKQADTAKLSHKQIVSERIESEKWL
jgi:hypothetical protein